MQTHLHGNNSSLFIEYNGVGGGRVKLTFHQVMSYGWVGDYDCLLPESDEFEFGLIEIFDSERLRALATAKVERIPGMELEGERVVFRGDVVIHHYRLGFDDHGTYDVICGDPVVISTSAVES
ncbi:hypothetical protein ACIRD3_37000 [Kitasatospora sp. NPDC093550]|uniref:hypothetical protein n=1 Tax=Kitasatospora sp. NPDC093550 TaxID=3364089 RepID=UPI00380ECC71